jgi:hypothetical protein
MWIALTGALPAELFMKTEAFHFFRLQSRSMLSCGYYVHKHDQRDPEILLVHSWAFQHILVGKLVKCLLNLMCIEFSTLPDPLEDWRKHACIGKQMNLFWGLLFRCLFRILYFIYSGSTYNKSESQRHLDESNKGHQMLRKMGWGGAGLGAKEQGIEQPISGGEVCILTYCLNSWFINA